MLNRANTACVELFSQGSLFGDASSSFNLGLKQSYRHFVLSQRVAIAAKFLRYFPRLLAATIPFSLA